MAYYSFNCPKCGEFTEWHTSMAGQKTYSSCPQCNKQSKRVFKPAGTFKMDQKVIKRIEKGMEPRVVNKASITGKKLGSTSVKSRPWQV